jgi:hypothetical protein
MARAIDPRQTFEFVLPEDEHLPDDAPDKTVWILRALTASEEAAIADDIVFQKDTGDGQEVRHRSGTTALKTLRLGVQGWRNLLGADDKPVEFVGRTVSSTAGKRIEATDDDLSKIHPRHRNRIANAITTAGKVTVDEAGKS